MNNDTKKRTETHACDSISRQAAIDAVGSMLRRKFGIGGDLAEITLAGVPSAQPEQTDCDYCHEDSDGYVKPIEKNCHAFIRFGMNGWEISLSAKGWSGSAKIIYCPMCGRRLER